MLSSHHFLDGVTGEGVEEQGQHGRQANKGQDFDDGPLVVVPYDVTDRFQRGQPPQVGRIRATEFCINGKRFFFIKSIRQNNLPLREISLLTKNSISY